METKIMADVPQNKGLESHLWSLLAAEQKKLASVALLSLFEKDPQRFSRFSAEVAHILFDYSKNFLTETIIQLLVAWAEHCALPDKITALFTGQCVNQSEQRPALHTALRDLSHTPIYLNGQDIKKEIHACWQLMTAWSEKIRHGHWFGATGKAITDVVHIGIGGSHLGPQLVVEALIKQPAAVSIHFVSNLDERQIQRCLQQLNPETTLFIVVSKTFTTLETLHNAEIAKNWLTGHLPQNAALAPHFIAITQYSERAHAFGIVKEHILPLWEWVGGRYSLWSSVGFVITLAIGMEGFQQLLQGAFAMDCHFRDTPLAQNMPVLFALIDLWYIHFFNTRSLAILPYNDPLRHLPLHLQQLFMESNGKSLQQNLQAVDYSTGVIVWGGNGNEGQHAYYQLLLQGTQCIPAEFIYAWDKNTSAFSQESLLASCLAQSKTFIQGTQQQTDLFPYQQIKGNQPNNTILLAELSPYTLGALLAFYEHRTFVQGALWNINSFDQWGVEQGKKNYQSLLKLLQQGTTSETLDSSTQGLIHYFHQLRSRH